jgi:integrase
MQTLDDIDLSPAVPVFRARRLDALAQLWLDDCLKRLGRPKPARPGHSQARLYSATWAGYKDDIAYFRRWWAEVGPAKGWELREDDFQEFNRWLMSSTSLGYTSRADALRRLRQMLRWAFTHRYITAMDFSLWVPKEPEGAAPLRTLAPVSVLAEVMRAMETTRDKAILAILVDTGMRRAECANLMIEDVQFTIDGSGTIKIRHAKVTKKKTEGRVAVFGAIAGRFLAAWIGELGEAGLTRGALFPSPMIPERPLDPNQIYRVVKRAIERAGYADAIQGPHDIRRIYVTENRRRQSDGAFDASLRKQVGHSSALVTDLYDYGELEDRRGKIVSPFEVLVQSGYKLE